MLILAKTMLKSDLWGLMDAGFDGGSQIVAENSLGGKTGILVVDATTGGGCILLVVGVYCW
jgi:hypothetical protein